VVEVDFDPKVITYDELLDLFWKAHDPSDRSSTGSISRRTTTRSTTYAPIPR